MPRRNRENGPVESRGANMRHIDGMVNRRVSSDPMNDMHPGSRLKKSAFDRRLVLLTVVLWVLSTPAHGRQQPAAALSFDTRNEREAFLGTARFATDPPPDGRP